MKFGTKNFENDFDVASITSKSSRGSFRSKGLSKNGKSIISRHSGTSSLYL